MPDFDHCSMTASTLFRSSSLVGASQYVLHFVDDLSAGLRVAGPVLRVGFEQGAHLVREGPESRVTLFAEFLADGQQAVVKCKELCGDISFRARKGIIESALAGKAA